MNLSLETVLRCLDLLPIVRENQGLTLADLARRSGIAEKVILDQLIPTLMLCGSPPYMPHDYVSIWLEGDCVFVSFADHFKRPVTLLPIEITALHSVLSSSFLPTDHEPGMERRFSELRRKIEEALPSGQRVFLEQTPRVSVEDNPERKSPNLSVLKQASVRKKKVNIQYLSSGDVTMKRRVVHPYGIIVKNGVTYVPSFDETRGHVVSFRLDRIHIADSMIESFVVDPDFSIERYARDGIFRARGPEEREVVIHVRGRTARFVAETLDQMNWSWQDRDLLVVRLHTSRPLGIVRLALGWGTEAEIVSPEDVRDLAREEILRLRAGYAT